MKPLKNKVSITLDADIIDRIKELAEEDDRSFSQYINLVLREHIKSLDKIRIMSDLKSGSSHMRLIFKVKKGQLSKLLLLNRPIIMAIYSRNLYWISD